MATSAYNTSLTKEWISLPHDLLLNDSFADDLLQQFDNKRTSLYQDNELDLQNEKPFTSQPPLRPTNRSSMHPVVTTENPASSSSSSFSAIITAEPSTQRRRSSAGDILRRSSAFFKSTLDQTWKNLSRTHDNDKEQQAVPITLTINTTITLPITRKSSQPTYPPLQPPVISTYPPKPLQYAPVDHPPLPDQKTLIKRLSMPVLRHRASNVASNCQRRKSDVNTPLPPIINKSISQT